MIAPTTRMRAIYDRVKERQPEIFGKSKLTVPGQLRCEASLQGTLNQVTFNLLENQGTQNGTERRLKITDNFIVTDYGFYLMKAGASTTATQAEIAVAILRTWPNPIVFTGAAEAVNLGAVYNGKHRILVNSDLFVDDALNSRFRRVPVTQKGNGPALAMQEDGWDNMNYGLVPCEPTLAFSGIGKNEVSVILPAPILTSGTSSQNFLVFFANGFNIVNANTGRL